MTTYILTNDVTIFTKTGKLSAKALRVIDSIPFLNLMNANDNLILLQAQLRSFNLGHKYVFKTVDNYKGRKELDMATLDKVPLRIPLK